MRYKESYRRSGLKLKKKGGAHKPPTIKQLKSFWKARFEAVLRR